MQVDLVFKVLNIYYYTITLHTTLAFVYAIQCLTDNNNNNNDTVKCVLYPGVIVEIWI